VHEVGVPQVVQAAWGKDLGPRLEPHGLAKGDVCILSQQLGGQAAQRAQHGPPCVDQLCLAVPAEPSVPHLVTFDCTLSKNTMHSP
jgi:hypothetical protein